MPGAACTVPAAPTVITSTPFRRAARIQSSTTGARSSTGWSPITTTRSASRIEESGARNASSSGAVCSGSTTASRAEAPADELRERLRLLDRLGAGEREQDRTAPQ